MDKKQEIQKYRSLLKKNIDEELKDSLKEKIKALENQKEVLK